MSYSMPLRPSARMGIFGSHWNIFRSHLYRKLAFTSVEDVKVWLKSGKNIRHFTW